VNLTENHIASKKRVGTLDGKPVVEIETTGGLYLLVMRKAAGVETLGAGSHKAVARYIAKKKHKNLEITELAKSEQVEPEHFAHLLPEWEAFTSRCNRV
jgi:hypothetical protein